MKKVLFILIAGCGVLTFSACKKNVRDNIDHRYTILTERDWRLEKMNINGARQDLQSCQLDDTHVFERSGLGIVRADQVRCNNNNGGGNGGNGNDTTQLTVPGSENLSFDWSMTGDNTMLHLHNFGPQKKSIDYLITDMDYDKMIVQYSEIINGTNFVYEVTFVPVSK